MSEEEKKKDNDDELESTGTFRDARKKAQKVPYKCRMCGRLFWTESEYFSHLSAEHG
jgi:uncharacterized protein with PIN domain